MIELSTDVALRAETEEDAELCLQVYASTRIEEFAPAELAPEQFAALMRQQFAAYTLHYRMRYPDAEYSIITLKGEPVGRLIVVRPGTEIYLGDGALLPEYRGMGIMSYLMLQVMEEAARAGLPVRLMVEKNNRAMNMYRRLGFENTSDIPTHHLMDWYPPIANS